MGYKILGIAVWRGGIWYARRRLRAQPGNLAIAGGIGLLAAGGAAAIVVSRRANRG